MEQFRECSKERSLPKDQSVCQTEQNPVFDFTHSIYLCLLDIFREEKGEGGNGKRTHSKEKVAATKSQSQDMSKEDKGSERKARSKERREERAEPEPLERPQHKVESYTHSTNCHWQLYFMMCYYTKVTSQPISKTNSYYIHVHVCIMLHNTLDILFEVAHTSITT